MKVRNKSNANQKYLFADDFLSEVAIEVIVRNNFIDEY